MTLIIVALVILLAAIVLGIREAQRFKNYVDDYPTTNGRIVLSTHTSIILALIVVAAVFIGWEPTDNQIRVLYGVGIALLIMQGLDVSQFGLKRFSDNDRAAIKAGAAPPTTNIAKDDATIITPPATKPPTPLSPTSTIPVGFVGAPTTGEADVNAELARQGKYTPPVSIPNQPKIIDGKLQPDD